MDKVVPKGVSRVAENIAKVEPENNLIITTEGNKY